MRALELAKARSVNPDDQRQMLRKSKSIPLAEAIKPKLDAYAANMSNLKNKFREAVSYAANNWTALMECFNHGHTRLDTNLLESKFRPTKRKARSVKKTKSRIRRISRIRAGPTSEMLARPKSPSRLAYL